MNKKQAHILFLLLLTVKVSVIAQSALSLTNGASISVSENTILTVQGNVLASAGVDTASISPKGKFQLTGNWENNSNGKLVDLSDGSVEFIGSAGQEIRGENAFNNLVINNRSGVRIASDFVNLNNELQLTSGNFETNDQLTLISIPSKTARIAPIIDGSISGDVTIQAYIENESYDYRFLSMPVQNKTLTEWSDDFLMTGFTGTPFPSFSFNSIFYYNERLSGDRNARYENAVSTNDPIALGTGVQAYIGASDILVDAKGEIYSGVVNFPVTFTDDATQDIEEDGWNLIGNPYPSTIDWSSSEWVRVNINDAIYVYEGSRNAYQTYINGVGTNGGTQYIPSSQAFWVKAIGAPTLIANENVKSVREIGFIEQEKQEIIRMNLSNSTHSDEIVIRFNQESTSKFDGNWDAYKLKGATTQPILTAIQDSIEYSILSSSIDSLDLPIYLSAEVPVSGYYNLNIGQLPSNVSCIFLEDLFTGRIENLRDSSSFRFLLSDTTTISRFKLTMSRVADYSISEALCYGSLTSIEAKSASASHIDFSWTSSVNFTPQVDSNQLTKQYSLNDGVYYFRADKPGCLTQLDTFSLISPSALTSQIVATPDSGFAKGTARINVSGGTAPYQIAWNTTPKQLGEEAFGLSAGSYNVDITDKNGCVHSDSVVIRSGGIITSIDEVSTFNSISIYPNPVENILTLNGIENLKLEYTLLDALGREVKSGRIDYSNFTINVSMLESGLYFLRLTNGTEHMTLKMKKV